MKACELIKDTDLNISHISKLAGYEEPKYFSKVFKRETGMTPSEYIDRFRMKRGYINDKEERHTD